MISKLNLPVGVALFAALAVGLMFLLSGGLLQAQETTTIEYEENDTAAVATYTAVDPEMTAITSWSLDGTDAGVFDIAGGVLSFKKSPDFEMAADERADGSVDGDNVYEITVQAIDSTGKTGMKMVEVMVTNVDEPGMVTLSALQPQAGTELTATHSDPDGTVSDLKLQWAKSMTMDGTYEDIDKAILSTYTPKDADIDYYLQVTASYTDAEGAGKTAMGTSAYVVQGLRSDNNAPKFADDQDPDMDEDQDKAAREVAENTPAGSAIGDPVVAEDEDGDILTYTLTGANAADFDIDRATGQIMTKAALDNVGENANGTVKIVIVRATDPAGDPQASESDLANSDTVTVDITITDVNEPPTFTGGAALTFDEEDGTVDTIAAALDTYTATDPEGTNIKAWSVAGADGSKFNIGNQTDGRLGELTFKAKPDYEMPTDANTDNVYEVTVRATDTDSNIGTMAVKVSVTNKDEDGTVTLSKTQPRVGVAVTASVTDPDGSISGLTWQWYDGAISENDLTDSAIEGANSDTYTPVAEDVGDPLSARASYTDGEGASKSKVGAAAQMVAVDTRNKAPVFEDQDTETDGVQNTATTREVEENTEALATDDALANDAEDAADNVGSPVTATDPDPNADPLTYTLEGTDASKFRVRDNGQIEVGAGTELDYETKTTYMVTVMAEDSFGDSASIMVTITVTDLNEGPDITGEDTIEHPENRTSSVETYRASDPERAGTITWSLAGTDAAFFDISSNGVLTFKEKPNYEMAADDDTDNMYKVTVQATDADRRMGTKPVTVEVTNVDEPGVVTLSARQPMAGTLLTANFTDPDGLTTNPEWQWQKGNSNIPGANMMTYTPADSDRGSYLRATVTYKDPESREDTKRANVRSDYAVLRKASDNNAPEFADDQDPATDEVETNAAREIAENTEAGENIGAPVAATDDDSDQRLTYTLEGNGEPSFDIDWATGQIMTKAALDFESRTSYTVTVRATDPALMDNSATVIVVITVTDVNEPPEIIGDAAVPFVGEAQAAVDDYVAPTLHTYTATNPAGANFTTGRWSVAGADGSKFNIGNQTDGRLGELTFKAKPDYENPTDTNMDNVYEVTVRTADADGYIGMKAVKVTVTNEDEGGTVTLSKTRPRVGIAVTARVTDPDGSISGLIWQWNISNAVGVPPDITGDGPIAGATSDTYTPKAGDFDGNLMATASYFDGQSAPDADADKKTAMKEADTKVAADTRNRAPVFEDQDTETDGVQNTETTRKVEENAVAVDDADPDVATDNVGRPVTANDPDPNVDALTYTLSGADADSFTVKDNGQIEVGAGTKLDYETKQTYMVTVMAEDSYGDSASIMVTIMVTDMDEAPEIMRAPDANVAPEFASATTSRTVAENMAAGEDIGNPVAATDANGDALTYALGGTNAASFAIDSATGQLSTKAALDYETKASYSVTVTASDSGGLSDSIDVTITVANVDERGTVILMPASPRVGTEISAALTDPDNVTAGTDTWQWSRSMTIDGPYMDIGRATSMTYTPVVADEGYYLMATARYDDGEGSDKSANAKTGSQVSSFAISGTSESSYMENGTEVIGTYTAGGREAASTTWMLGGADVDNFMVEPSSGLSVMLKFRSSPDYEAPMDSGGDNTYQVTLTVEDGTYMDTKAVKVIVTDVEELGTLSGDSSHSYMENGDGAVGTYTASDGSMSDVANWSLMGDDMGDLSISSSGMLTFDAMPNYEMPMDEDMDNTYTVTVMAEAGGEMDEIMVTVMVTNVNEDGTVTLSTQEPMTGMAITADLTDPDIAAENTDRWQWSKSMTMDGTYVDIDMATSMSYTPMTADVGYYLRATVMYTDGHGSGKTAMATTTTSTVTAADPLLAKYDTNGDQTIDRGEVIAAILRYFAEEPGVTRTEVIAVIHLYFASE